MASPMYFSIVPPHVVDDRGHRAEVVLEQGAQSFRIELLAQVGRADDVGEQDRGELALLGRGSTARAA